jgi:hypothetical protein
MDSTSLGRRKAARQDRLGEHAVSDRPPETAAWIFRRLGRWLCEPLLHRILYQGGKVLRRGRRMARDVRVDDQATDMQVDVSRRHAEPPDVVLKLRSSLANSSCAEVSRRS